MVCKQNYLRYEDTDICGTLDLKRNLK
jgi:hypothetical protein